MLKYVLILAAGQGSRLKKSKVPKQFLEVNQLPVVMHSMYAFKAAYPECKIYIALCSTYIVSWSNLCQKYNFKIPHESYKGGGERLTSVFRGLKLISEKHGESEDVIAIHDAARPFIKKDFIIDLVKPFEDQVIRAVIPFQGLKESIVEYIDKKIKSTDRKNYGLCQTPQCFRFFEIFKAYKEVFEKNIRTDSKYQMTTSRIYDDFSIFEYNLTLNSDQKKILFIKGLEHNIKITTDLDYYLADTIYKHLHL